MIKTKAQLMTAMHADRNARLFGHHGARPSSPWKYELLDAEGKLIDAVSSVAVGKLTEIGALFRERGSWLYSCERLSVKFRATLTA